MRSFKDINGNNIPFESKHDLSLDVQTDVVSNEVTAYLVEYNDSIYEVSQEVYDALENL